MFREIVLASGSPRRLQLLQNLGLSVRVFSSGVSEETGLTDSLEHVRVLALRKAASVQPPPDGCESLVIGADTVVMCDSRRLEKPATAAQAREMLETLSGREHQVLTGVAIIHHSDSSRTEKSAAERTLVRFRTLGTKEIDQYIGSGEPMDKAGAYGIQGRGAAFVTGITGCYFNVVGLPLHRLYLLARSMDVDLFEYAAGASLENQEPWGGRSDAGTSTDRSAGA